MLTWGGTGPGLWSRGLDRRLCTLQKGTPRQEATSRTSLSPKFYPLRTALSYPPLRCHITKPSAICPQPWGLRVVWSQKSQVNEMPIPVWISYFLSLTIKFNPARPWAVCAGQVWPYLNWVLETEKTASPPGTTVATERGFTHHSREETQVTGDQTCSLVFDLRCLKDRHLNPYLGTYMSQWSILGHDSRKLDAEELQARYDLTLLTAVISYTRTRVRPNLAWCPSQHPLERGQNQAQTGAGLKHALMETLVLHV